MDERQKELIDRVGFGYLSRLRSFPLDHALLAALVERWRYETNTFHLPVGEVAPTLLDMKIINGLPFDGDAVTGVQDSEHEETCEECLGMKVPGNNLV
jgi:hypothetical protein